MEETQSFDIVDFEYEGRTFHFALGSDVDHIQSVIRAGGFYEIEELEMLREYCPTASFILDVGANIGNHSVYLSHFLNPKKVVMIEPNPLVLPLLKANSKLNWHPSFDLSMLGKGLGRARAQADIGPIDEGNLGAAKLVLNEGGAVAVHAADELFPNSKIDLLKIDVEGMELDVLEGMNGLLRKGVSVIFVEVLEVHKSPVRSLLEAHGYSLLDEYKRYPKCTNLVFKE